MVSFELARGTGRTGWFRFADGATEMPDQAVYICAWFGHICCHLEAYFPDSLWTSGPRYANSVVEKPRYECIGFEFIDTYVVKELAADS